MCKVFSQLLVSFFRQKNKRTYLSLADTLMNLMYLCLVSFLLWLLAVSFWLLVFLYVMLNLVQHLSAEKDERWLAVRS